MVRDNTCSAGVINIYIGTSGGAPSENNTIRIGAVQTGTFVAGIYTATAASGVPVFVNASGQLGSPSSCEIRGHSIHGRCE